MPIEIFGEGLAGAMLRGIVLTAGAVLWTLLLVRLIGLRAFSKMTAFDFVATVATASIIAQAGTRADWIEFLQAITALGAVFLLQWLLARARLFSPAVAEVIRNEPLLLMRDGQFLEDAMQESRVSRSNLLEKIRQSGAGRIEDVRALVLETTGDISVLTSDHLDPRLLDGVRGA